eukprot:m.221555 g.221555  ORF g.221555 m.221555 type:complete len:67 (+) comp39960_c1_seq51:614-814(+)
MPDHLGGDMRRVKGDDEKDEKIQALDAGDIAGSDIALLKTYEVGPHTRNIKNSIEDSLNKVGERIG